MANPDANFIANMKAAFELSPEVRQHVIESGAIKEAKLNAIERNIHPHGLTFNEACNIYAALKKVCQWEESINFERFHSRLIERETLWLYSVYSPDPQ